MFGTRLSLTFGQKVSKCLQSCQEPDFWGISIGLVILKQATVWNVRSPCFFYFVVVVVFGGWPENTDPRSVDLPTDPVNGLPYGPVRGPLLRTPPHGPPKKIAEKENKQKYKQKWQKDLTYHLNGLTARVGENSNVYFRKINRLGRKVILIEYFAACGDVWKTTKDQCALKIENFICVLFRLAILLGSVSCVRDHKLDPGLTKNNTTCLLWQPWMTGESSLHLF